MLFGSTTRKISFSMCIWPEHFSRRTCSPSPSPTSLWSGTWGLSTLGARSHFFEKLPPYQVQRDNCHWVSSIYDQLSRFLNSAKPSHFTSRGNGRNRGNSEQFRKYSSFTFRCANLVYTTCVLWWCHTQNFNSFWRVMNMFWHQTFLRPDWQSSF